MYSKQIIEEIKSKIDIVELISRYVSLQKVGNNYRGLCPFHTETTPSFYVNPSFRTFHCFGCGASGDVFSFLEKIENISFSEALQKLAKEANVKIDVKTSTFQQLYYKFYSLVHQEYKNQLKISTIALDYLKNRGFSNEEILEYEFGFSPLNSSIPLKISQQLGIKILRKFGFTSKDLFEGRLIIPIKDEYGKTIAFGGRLLGEGQPKYLNSFDTDLFKKSKTLFLLDRAKEKIKNADFAIVCEGYFDALAFHRADLKNSIATLGTAFTKFHAYKLKKLTQNVVLSFDTDKAGIKATLQSIKILLTMDFNVMVANKSSKKDPDEIFKSSGKDGLYNFIKESIPAEKFIPIALSKNYNLENPNAISLFISEIRNWEIIFEKFPKKLEIFKDKVKEISGSNIFTRRIIQKNSNLPTLDDMIIYLIINYPDIELDLNPKILSKRLQEILKYLKNFSFENMSKDLQEYVKDVLKKMENVEITEEFIKNIKKQIKRKNIEKRIEEIDQYIKNASDDEKRILLQTRIELIRKLKNI
ncbi:DNA primase [Thermosipho sp. 1063]|uniref:DNA primase n=1 Tax=unclassified Thermosipho (in: thermotogales) TaxID=2676525 RepID=UPI0009493FBB|nr:MULTISPECIES: DNA primase [unclassified Thermosipho (in: thermotogales)]ANQ53947.1 DNA primase [Thermosipho sp. 1070]APT72393.1 DNA primase [Thermosipho sp. 1063]OOC43635.1 DNA primase [Thermosipho sp. 1074]